MKKLILLFVMAFIFSSICNAEEILSLHGDNMSLTIDDHTLLGIGIFLGSCVIAITIIIGLHIDHKNNECLINMNYSDILKKRFVSGKIQQEKFDLMKKSLVELNNDLQNQNNVCHTHNCMNSVPEKCSSTK